MRSFVRNSFGEKRKESTFTSRDLVLTLVRLIDARMTYETKEAKSQVGFKIGIPLPGRKGFRESWVSHKRRVFERLYEEDPAGES